METFLSVIQTKIKILKIFTHYKETNESERENRISTNPVSDVRFEVTCCWRLSTGGWDAGARQSGLSSVPDSSCQCLVSVSCVLCHEAAGPAAALKLKHQVFAFIFCYYCSFLYLIFLLEFSVMIFTQTFIFRGMFSVYLKDILLYFFGNYFYFTE